MTEQPRERIPTGAAGLDAQLHRMFLVVKTRDSDYDGTLRELVITPRGASLGEPRPSGMPGTAGKPAPRWTDASLRARLFRALGRRGWSP